MVTQQNYKMTDCEEQSEKIPVMVPDREVLEITLLGLSLDLKDNLTCGLVIVLAIALQIRLSNTFLAEGLIVFGGIVGYISMRYWLLSRRYPEPGDLVIENGMLHIPPSVNGGLPTSFELANCIVLMNFHRGKSGDNPTSVIFRFGGRMVKINSLSIDLGKLERALVTRHVLVQKDYWYMGVYAIAFMLIAALSFFFYLIVTGGLR